MYNCLILLQAKFKQYVFVICSLSCFEIGFLYVYMCNVYLLVFLLSSVTCLTYVVILSKTLYGTYRKICKIFSWYAAFLHVFFPFPWSFSLPIEIFLCAHAQVCQSLGLWKRVTAIDLKWFSRSLLQFENRFSNLGGA